MREMFVRHVETLLDITGRADKILGERERSVADLLGLNPWQAFRLFPVVQSPRVVAIARARLDKLEAAAT